MEQKYQKIIQQWEQIPHDYSEPEIEANLVQVILNSLGLDFQQIKTKPALRKGIELVPDRLVYADITKPPVLVIENKPRIASLASTEEQNHHLPFLNLCKEDALYQEAIGSIPQKNGIKEYLNKDIVPPAFLASYGLVFNGDFFQLWRRVEGLILPLTSIQRMTAITIPKLMQQLEYCLKNPQRALVTSIWNQKGGVAKTTNTINIGATLALKGKKVLLIDLNEQTDLTQRLGIIPNQITNWLPDSVYKVEQKELADAKYILKEAIQNLLVPTTDGRTLEIDVLPMDGNTLDKFRGSKDINHIKSFREIVNLLAVDYDYIFLDTSPTADILTKCTISSIDTILIPLDYGQKSIEHAVKTYQFMSKIREQRSTQEQLYIGPWNLGLVYSNCPPDSDATLEKLVNSELDSYSFVGRQCKTRIKTYAQTKIAEFKHMPVIHWQNSPVTASYKNLVDEVFLMPNFINE